MFLTFQKYLHMKFRSKYEHKIFDNIPKKYQRSTNYEPSDPVIRYHLPKCYIPDFVLGNGILVEAKGYFKSADRTKMLRIRKENPDLDIRFLFQRANNRLTKSPNSMMYWEWAEKHGFKWAEGDKIPEKWFREKQ